MAKSRTTSTISDQLKKILNHYIVKNVLILFLIGFFILYGTLVVIRHYTHHGEALPVPDVTGMTLSEAGKALETHQLRWRLSDSVYLTTVKPGAIVNQNPEAGFKVKKNRNVFLTINALMPEKVKMPNVVGVSFRQAKTILESQGLNVGKLTYTPDIAKNNVLKQNYKGGEIRKGTEVVKGSEIDLVLGGGLSNERTDVPNLAGLTLSDVRGHLAKYSLNLGVITFDDAVVSRTDSLGAFVWRQEPASGMLQLGASVDVWLTTDQTKNPDVIPATSN